MTDAVSDVFLFSPLSVLSKSGKNIKKCTFDFFLFLNTLDMQNMFIVQSAAARRR